MLRSEVIYELYPIPLRIKGPKVLVTAAPTFNNKLIPIHK
jgi:hypothetical protein